MTINPVPETVMSQEERGRMHGVDLILEHLAAQGVLDTPVVAGRVIDEFNHEGGPYQAINWDRLNEGNDHLLLLAAWLFMPAGYDPPELESLFENLDPAGLGVALSALTAAGRGRDAETSEHRLLTRLFADQDHGPMLNISFATAHGTVVKHGLVTSTAVMLEDEQSILIGIRDARLFKRVE